MKKCKSCQTEIDSKAKKCPHCQSDQRSWFARHPILTGILGLILLSIVARGVGGGESNTQPTATKNSSNVEEKATPTPVPEKINVEDLADDFDANQVAAEAKWKGKLVEFSAEITNITDFGLSFRNIATAKEFSFTQVSCKIKDKQQLLSLANGQIVTVRGVVKSQTIGVISVSDCEVVQ